eukprot:3308345-Prymnesium_polylepis.1
MAAGEFCSSRARIHSSDSGAIADLASAGIATSAPRIAARSSASICMGKSFACDQPRKRLTVAV